MDSIKQRVVSIPVEGSDAINVRRLKWKHAREFLRRFSEHAGKFGSIITAAQPEGGEGATPVIKVDLEKLLGRATDIVIGADDLSAYLVEHSTGLTTAQADDLDTVVALEVLRTACELNLGDELKNSLLGIGKTLAALFPSTNKTNAGASSTTTS